MGGGREGLGGPEPCLHPPATGAQGPLGVVQTAGGQAPGDGDALRAGAHPPRQDFPTRALGLGTPPQPATAVCDTRPPGPGRAARTEEAQGGVCFDPLDGGQVDARQARERGTGSAPGVVGRCMAAGCGGQGRSSAVVGTGLQRRCALRIAVGHRLVGDVVQRDGVAEGTPLLGAPMTLQGLGPGGPRGVPGRVTPLGPAWRMALARDHGSDAGQAGHARDVPDHWGAREVHRGQGLVPGRHRGRGRGAQPVAVAQRAAPPAHLGSGTEGPGAQPLGVAVWPPRASEPSRGGPARDTRGLAGSAQEPRHAPGLPPLKHGPPGDAGRCPGAGGHAPGQKPVGQSVAGSGACAETAHGWGGAPRGHGAPGLRVTDVAARGVGVTEREGGGEHGGLRERRRRGGWTRGKARVFGGCQRSLREQDRDVGAPWGRAWRQNGPSPTRDQGGAWHQ